MGPSPKYHPPQGEEFETSVEHGLPLWAEPAVGYCSRRPRPSPMWGSRFVGARAVGPWVGEQKPLGKSSLRGSPSPESTYLPTYLLVFDEENVLLLKYNKSRITQARDEQVEDKQDQSMKGCSHKELDKDNYQQ